MVGVEFEIGQEAKSPHISQLLNNTVCADKSARSNGETQGE